VKNSYFVHFLLGIWLGTSVFAFTIVGYSFGSIGRAMEANEKLARRAGFDPADEGALKTSTLWVYTGELNRAFFHGWNRAQLGLGAVTLLSVLLLLPRRGLALALILAGAIVIFLTFHLAPEITLLGRQLDFLPRDPPPTGLDSFGELHRAYFVLEAVKTALLGLAVALGLRQRPEAAANV
jgi:hypothetical protein